ncbi:hypothetical protein EIP91_011018, partial [Steccherinum ochraceum]
MLSAHTYDACSVPYTIPPHTDADLVTQKPSNIDAQALGLSRAGAASLLDNVVFTTAAEPAIADTTECELDSST